MNIKSPTAGYVPGAADADGSEDPVPTAALQSTGAVSAGKPRLDDKGQPILIEGNQQVEGSTKLQTDQTVLPASPPTRRRVKK